MKSFVFVWLAVLAILASGCDDDPAASPDVSVSSPDAAVLSPDAAVPLEDAGERVDSGDDAGVFVEVDTPITDRFRTIAETFERERQEFGAPGAALLILENGEITFARGFGVTDPNGNDEVRSTTLFRIGSVNKVLTAAVLLGLVSEGAVSLDDPLTTPVPDFNFAYDASWAPSIHVRHLINHSAGIVDYTPIDVPEAQHLDSALNDYLTGEFERIGYLMSPPGRMWNYSNPNFYFAGLVIEKTAGVGYRQAMRDRLFAPLGMDRTFFLGSEVLEDGDYANGVTPNEQGQPTTVTPNSYENAWARPAGFAFSSVRDLAKFVLFLERGNTAVLPDAERESLFAPQMEMKTFFDLDHYGFGLILYDGVFLGGEGDFRRMKVITHGGAIPGYSAEIWYIPSLRFGFVTLASTDNAYFYDTLGVALSSLTQLPAAELGPSFTPDPADYPRYAGSYDDPFNIGPVEVIAHTTSISVTMPELDRLRIPYEHELVPTSPDNFIWTVQGYPLGLTFILDEMGNSEYFRTRLAVAPRVNRARLRSPPASSPLDRERFLRAVKAESVRAPRLYR